VGNDGLDEVSGLERIKSGLV